MSWISELIDDLFPDRRTERKRRELARLPLPLPQIENLDPPRIPQPGDELQAVTYDLVDEKRLPGFSQLRQGDRVVWASPDGTVHCIGVVGPIEHDSDFDSHFKISPIEDIENA